MPNPKSDSWDVENRFQIYSLFYAYYSSTMWDLAKWGKVVSVLKSFLAYKYNVNIAEGTGLLENVTAKDVEKAYFDYHRLFVGPGKLLAPPYESFYRNADGLLMQQETLQVRDFYKKVGVAVAEQGTEPDDHIVLELELMCYLLYKTGKSLRETGKFDLRSYRYYREFYRKHLQQWIYLHCADILCHSRTSICRGMGTILKGFMELENEHLNSQEGGNCIEQQTI